MPSIAMDESKFSTEDGTGCDLQGSFAERTRLKKHHLPAKAAVVLLEIVNRLPFAGLIGKAAQAEVHQPLLIALLQAEN